MSIGYNQTAPPTGSVLLPLNYELVPFSCHFELSRTRDIGEGPPYLLSVTFDVEVDSSQQPVTWSQASGPTPSLSAHPSTSTASTISHTTVAATFSVSTPNPGLNDSAKAGIGVGVTLGVLSLVIVTAIILWRCKRKGTMQPVDRGQDLDEINFAKSQAGNSEMPAEAAVHEMHGSLIAASRLNHAGELEAPS